MKRYNGFYKTETNQSIIFKNFGLNFKWVMKIDYIFKAFCQYIPLNTFIFHEALVRVPG